MIDLDRKELVLIIQCLEYRIYNINLLPFDDVLLAYKAECSSLHMKLLRQLDEYKCDDCKDAFS